MNYQNHEDPVLLAFITKPKSRILDIGCGLGRYLIPLTTEEHFVVGIDKNPEIVKMLNLKGYSNVYTVSDASRHLTNDFDYIIMSHIIEHIEPKDLIAFFDNYLQYLKLEGKLLIATPVLHSRFFDDYDHIKPYAPKTFTLLFSDYEQYQEKPQHRLKLENVWLRKDPFELNCYPGTSDRKEKFIKNVNKLLINLYKISRQQISETTGWIGVFSRIS